MIQSAPTACHALTLDEATELFLGGAGGAASLKRGKVRVVPLRAMAAWLAEEYLADPDPDTCPVSSPRKKGKK